MTRAQEFGSREASGSTHPTLSIVAAGTEVSLVGVAKDLPAASTSAWVGVVSMPCCELFVQQPLEYQRGVLSVCTANSPVMSVEAGGVRGWQKYAHVSFGLDNTVGMSAPAEQIYMDFGVTRQLRQLSPSTLLPTALSCGVVGFPYVCSQISFSARDIQTDVDVALPKSAF